VNKFELQSAHQTPGLYQRVVKAGVWTLGAHGIEIITRLLSTLILTRLLFPEAFGLIAAATSLLVGLALISDFGIRTVILQSSSGDQDEFLRTAWTLQVCRGFALWFVLVLMCTLINLPVVQAKIPSSSVFADPQFALIAGALGISLVLGGLESTSVHLNVRELNLKPVFFLDLAARTVNVPVMVIWAWLMPSVWALVAGSLTAGIVRLISSHLFVPGPRMYFRLDKDQAREIVHFGKWINVSSLATFVAGQSDRLILGLLLPSSVFGLYAIARTLIDTAQGVFERLNSTLALPALSAVARRARSELKSRYYRLRVPFDLSLPLISGCLVSAGSLVVHILFDERYAEVGPIVQILAIGLLVFPSLIISSAFTANGEPHIGAIVSVVQAISLVLCLTIGFLIGGTIGMFYGVALYNFVPAALILSIGYNRGWIDVWKEVRVVFVFAVGLAIGEFASVTAKFLEFVVP
jgi:O-antigen/teichoic acid export membrane protein